MTLNYECSYLLDTNIISDLLRNPRGKVTRKIKELGEESICTSIIVASELRFSALKKGSDKLTQRIDSILSSIDIIPYEDPADFYYATLRHFLEKNGTLIGPNDMLIAARVLSLNLIVVTVNTGEFSRVPDLKVVNWI